MAPTGGNNDAARALAMAEGLRKEMDMLQQEMKEHIKWANDTMLKEQRDLNETITSLRTLITTKADETKRTLSDEIKEARRNDWESRVVKVGWLVALVSPVAAVIASHVWR